MLPPIPRLEDYDISPCNGFLPHEPPLTILPDPYYAKWEAVVKNLQALLLSKRLREVIEDLPIITTSRLRTPAEWRRAYVLLAFMAHSYIWGGDRPEEVVPPTISIPFLQVCRHLELPPVATYAGVCLWNWKPIFDDEPFDDLSNLSTLVTYTGSLDESWFYLVSVAIEARGGPLIPLMLRAIAAAREEDVPKVTECLRVFAERIDDLGGILTQMYENCDPHVFYHRIRPFLAGSKNMADAGLPRGVLFDTGSGRDSYVQCGGGSNAQSSLIQFLDIVLGVEHHPTGSKPSSSIHSSSSSFSTTTSSHPATINESSDPSTTIPTAPPPSSKDNFIHEMRTYMPGPHRRFLSHLTSVANIRPFVTAPQNRSNTALALAYDAAIAMLRALRDKHMQMVSRYIVVKSREQSRSQHGGPRSLSPTKAPRSSPPHRHGGQQGGTVSDKSGSIADRIISPSSTVNLATVTGTIGAKYQHQHSRHNQYNQYTQQQQRHPNQPGPGGRTGTGGTALIPFLKQARDETADGAVGDWFRRMMRGRSSRPYPGGIGSRDMYGGGGKDAYGGGKDEGKLGVGREEAEEEDREEGGVQVVGLNGVWRMDDCEGGICHW